MVSKSKAVSLVLMIVVVFSLSVILAAAQYDGQKTTNVTIPSNGSFSAIEYSLGIAFQIVGTPGATGTVTTNVFNGNPQPTAYVPSGIALTNFIGLNFNLNADDFSQATVIISYNDSTVKNIQSPYSVYKYNSNDNSYTPLFSNVDTNAKTITITLTSVTDPLLAIGGAPRVDGVGIPTSTWVIIVITPIIVVIAVVFLVRYLRKNPAKPDQPENADKPEETKESKKPEESGEYVFQS